MVKICLLILACAIIVLCLIQEDKTDGIMSLTSGSNLKLFQTANSRGTDKVISIATAVCGALFMILVAIEALL